MKKIVFLYLLVLGTNVASLFLLERFFSFAQLIDICLYAGCIITMFILKFLIEIKKINFKYQHAQKLENDIFVVLSTLDFTDFLTKKWEKNFLALSKYHLPNYVEKDFLILDTINLAVLLLIYLFWVSNNLWLSVIACLLLFPTIFFTAFRGMKVLYAAHQQEISSKNQLINLENQINDREEFLDIKANSAEEELVKKFNYFSLAFQKIRFKNLFKADVIYNISSFLVIILLFLIFFSLDNSNYSIGIFVILIQFLLNLFPSIEMISQNLYEIQNRIQQFKLVKLAPGFAMSEYRTVEDNHLQLLSLKNIEIKIGTSLIKYNDLQIQPGDEVLVTGHNGAGKISLIYVIAGFFPPVRGQIVISKMIKDKKDIKICAKTAYLQAQNLKRRQIKPKIFKEISTYMYSNFGLSGNQNQGLSKGEIQKINIELALIDQANLYIFDEPVNNLDQAAVAKFYDYLNHLDETVIVVSHTGHQGYQPNVVYQIGGLHE